MLAQINGTAVFYTTHGQGRPLLIMHGGLGLDHSYFRPWLDPLGAQELVRLLDDQEHPRRRLRVLAGPPRRLVGIVGVVLGLLHPAQQVGDHDVGELGHAGVGEVDDRKRSRL